MSTEVMCKIEHQAVIFALMAKEAIIHKGDHGRNVILKAMEVYGRQRGVRMAKNAKAHGDEPNVLTNQIYGEWKTDYEGQMIFGRLQEQPTLQTYISKCAWCEAWQKYDLLDYGKYYCEVVDNAVYQGFQDQLVCTPTTTSLSHGGTQCEFDWGAPLNEEDVAYLNQKKAEIGTSCIKDFNFHTAHMYYAVGDFLKDTYGADGTAMVEAAVAEYIKLFGQEYFDVLTLYKKEDF